MVETLSAHPEQPSVELLDEKQFPEDLAERISHATGQVVIQAMQAEVSPETEPIFESAIEAKDRGVPTTVRLDRVTRRHIWEGENQAWLHNGNVVVHKGDRQAVKEANAERENLFTELISKGILNPDFHKRITQKFLSHDHIKMALVDGVAWLGTMNFRAKDFKISNFMLRITDENLVKIVRYVNEQIESGTLLKDRVFRTADSVKKSQTDILVDAGNRFGSVIYDKAVKMIESLSPGDEFVMISQWPPAKLLFGKIIEDMTKKAELGAKGTFLMSPAEFHHPVKKLSYMLQRRMEKIYGKNPNLDAINLPRQTHAKALLIKRADGKKEVLVGSHNFSRMTVWNGTREMAMWTDDPEVVGQVESFLDDVQNE